VSEGIAALVAGRGAALLEGLDAHLPGAREHSDAVGTYALAVAVELGFERERAELIREVARLHEVGKVYLPTDLLARPESQLTPDEREQLDSHFGTGRDLARGAGVPEEVCEWILLIRERFDGRSPSGLGGEKIPIASRIARAACACDSALAAPADAGETPVERHRQAIAELRRTAGNELDPDVVEALVAVVERAAPADE
jgi:HD-GYP domain-containing protein (c-di-GMP phosphodiesterase class II)